MQKEAYDTYKKEMKLQQTLIEKIVAAPVSISIVLLLQDAMLVKAHPEIPIIALAATVVPRDGFFG